ncbi:olfactory receptor 11H6-like [Microcaecilia unicolor]|uniref:Olfactory receptor 11H6-like n=1 Tax=Microcaecilia unicolor TaxID=1415580 RepID=A0A6P7WQX9_9AMPH|nr:olfactory receptor 11H6-like [Microcaecilia unicolor]
MQEGNETNVIEFILHGLAINGSSQAALFILFLIIYLLTLIGNIAIIMLVWSNTSLHKPMYIFLGNLSFLEIWYTTSTVPKMLYGLTSEINSISFKGCFIQFYFFFSCGATEHFLLTVMGYDRYLAICHPLHYNVLMSNNKCFIFAASCWIAGFLWSLFPIILISTLSFCGPNEINHFLCDPGPLLELSCKRDYSTEVIITAYISVLLFLTSSFTFISYAFIIQTILRIPSASGRRKAFSTCASHIVVVSIFFGCVMYMYVRPPGNHPFDIDKVIAVFYTVVTPLLNPVIYSLRNKEVLVAVKKMMRL